MGGRMGFVIAAALAAAPAAALAAPAPDATQAQAPSGVTSYPASFFAPLRPNTALDMVNALPGFSLDAGGGVRGFGGAAGNVLIDGDRPASKNDTLDQLLERIPASSVARIDVIRGGAPGIDMQGKPVIANVVRKAGGGLKLTTQASLLALWNGRFEGGGRLEGALRVGQTEFDGSLLLARDPDDGSGDGPHTVTDALGRLAERDTERQFGEMGTDKATASMETPLLGGRLRLEGSYLHTPTTEATADASPIAADRQLERFRQTQDTGEAGARYVRRVGKRLELEIYALQQLGRFASADDLATATDVSTFRLGKRTGESILRGIATLYPAANLTLETGAEGDYNWLTGRTAETDRGLPIAVPAANVRVRELRGEAFGDVTWRASKTLTLEGALRVEASRLSSAGDVAGVETFVFAKPRAVATWAPDGADQVQLRLEREVGQLDFGNFTASGTLLNGEHAGNPQLTPQQDWVIEATFDRRFWGGGDATLAVRRYWFEDVIDTAPTCAPAARLPGGACDPAAEFDAPANVGSGAREELSASLTLPTDRLGLKGGQLIVRATWRRSQVIDPSTRRPREFSNLHPVDAEAHFNQGISKLKLAWGWDAFSAWRQSQYRFSEIDTQRLGWWIDLYTQFQPRPDLTLRLEADNLATHGQEQVRALYSPFRDVGGGQLASVDNRSPRFGPEFLIRVRKTFG